jgi:hypothetical protein
MAMFLVDLQDVLAIAEIVVRIERDINGSRGRSNAMWRASSGAGTSVCPLGGGGFTATLQRNPSVDAEPVLLRLLELPASLCERNGTTSFVAFDEIQDPAGGRRCRRKAPKCDPAPGGRRDLCVRGLGSRGHAAAVRRPEAAAARSGGAEKPHPASP